MGKEVKIGIAIIGTLMVTLVSLLYLRLTGSPLLSWGQQEPSSAVLAPSAPPPRATISADQTPPASDAQQHNWVRAAEPTDSSEPRDEGAPPRAAAGMPPANLAGSLLPEATEQVPSGAEVDASASAPSEEAPLDSDTRGETSADTHLEPRSQYEDPEGLRSSARTEQAEPSVRSNPSSDPFRSRLARAPEAAAPEGSTAATVHRDEQVRPAQALAPPPRFDDAALEDSGRFESATSGDSDFAPPRSTEAAPPAAHDEPYRQAPRELPQEQAADFAEPSSRLVSAPPRARQPRVDARNGKYVVQPNDTFWIISEKVYGTGGYFKALYEHNRRKFPREDRLRIGDEIAAPAPNMLEQTYPKLCPKPRRLPTHEHMAMPASANRRVGGKTYVVEEGDTLFDIARYELGKAGRWTEIYDLNRDVLGDDFDFLQPGTQLAMPGSTEEGDALTRQPDETLQR